MSISSRIKSIKNEYIDWYSNAKKTFPKPNTGLNPVVSREYKRKLQDILFSLDPVLARFKTEKQDILLKKLQHGIEQQSFFRYDAGGTENIFDYARQLYIDFLSVLEECYDYFEEQNQNTVKKRKGKYTVAMDKIIAEERSKGTTYRDISNMLNEKFSRENGKKGFTPGGINTYWNGRNKSK